MTDGLDSLVASAAAAAIDGYEPDTYWHLSHLPCPKTGNSDSIVLYVPVDKTGWNGPSCGACGQQLTQS